MHYSNKRERSSKFFKKVYNIIQNIAECQRDGKYDREIKRHEG